MSITVLEAMKLDIFKNFRLIAGYRGLENKIEKVGILDYEYDKKFDEQPYKGSFEKDQFVITSLLFAKDNQDIIIEAVRNLMNDGVSGLAIKNIYYNDLPPEVINLANDSSFPIFIFDKNGAYFEEIITDIMDRIRFVDSYELLETKIDILIKRNISKATVRELALEINSGFKECYFVAYCKEKRYVGNNKIIAVLDSVKHNRNIETHTSILKYRNGILVVSTHDKIDENSINKTVNTLIKSTGINISDYYIGISNLHYNLDELDKGINESIFALKTGEVTENYFEYYRDMGIYSIIMPYIGETWINDFYNRIVIPLKDYDEKYNTELFNTAVRYIENDGNLQVTAEELFLHKNTIRYRVNKIKELLNMEDKEGSFYEQLSIALKIHKLYNK